MFIVGLYKCGTSWLLSALGAHPSLVPVREFDLIRAIYGNRPTGRVKGPAERVRSFFSASSWCPLRPEVAARASELAPTDAVCLLRDTLKQEKVRQHLPGGAPLAYNDLDWNTALELYQQVLRNDSAADLLGAFLDAVRAEARVPPVLKAADQIAVFDELHALAPYAPKVAIVRDGRDAAISGLHFKRLMRERGAPWLQGGEDYWSLLRGWSSRARMALEEASAGRLYLLRYEDLTLDFAGTFGPLCSWLGVDASSRTLRTVEDTTSFEAVTGRCRGSEAASVRRKGAIREWTERLTPSEREKAWKLAAKELRALGYTEDGRIEAGPPVPDPAATGQALR